MAGGASEEARKHLLFCKTDDVRNVHTILSTINFKKDLVAYCEASLFGLKFTVQRSNTLHADVYVKEELFSEYSCRFTGTEAQDEASSGGGGMKHEFGVNLTNLLDCLSIFTSSSGVINLSLFYDGPGSALQLRMVEGGVTSLVELSTIHTSGPTDFAFNSSDVLDKVIMHSHTLKEALSELSWWGDTVELRMSQNAPFFRLYSSGAYGSCQLDFPESSQVFDLYDCREDVAFSYQLALLQCLVKALTNAEKVAVRVTSHGMLSCQLMIKGDGATVSFAEFLLCCNIEDEFAYNE